LNKNLLISVAAAAILASGSAFAQSGEGPMQQMRPGMQRDGMNEGRGMHGMGHGMGMHGGMGQGMHRGMGPGMHRGGMHGGMGMHGGTGHGMHGMGHQSHGAAAPAKTRDAATIALQAVNAQMHDAMNIEYAENPDVDFTKSMIPHHQGAIDMAKVLLAFGKNPELRKLAEDIIKTQEQEIAWMKEWLKKNSQP
jgi:uncharacterized protein (DUF305 family)